MNDLLETITAKKEQLDSYRPLPPALVKNLDEWFKVELTYTSNAIEGNTLSRLETELIVEKGITVAGKTLQEHLEATNHAAALENIKKLVSLTRFDIDEATVLQIHKDILTNIDNVNAGRYRNVNVRIAGVETTLPDFTEVSALMAQFTQWLSSASVDHPAKIAGEAHFRLVRIHPFVDGNGRTARLLMNLLLLQTGYPPCLIRKEDRKEYIDAIVSMEKGDDLEFYRIIYEGINRSLDVYLEAVTASPTPTTP